MKKKEEDDKKKKHKFCRIDKKQKLICLYSVNRDILEILCSIQRII